MKTTLIGLTAFAVAVLALHHAPAPTFEPPELPSMQQAAAAAPRLQLQPMIRDGGTRVLAIQVRF